MTVAILSCQDSHVLWQWPVEGEPARVQSVFDRATHIVTARGRRDMPGFQNGPADVLIRASVARGDLSANALHVEIEFHVELGLVVVGGDDHIASLVPCGIETVVVDDPSPKCVVFCADLCHRAIIAPEEGQGNEVEPCPWS